MARAMIGRPSQRFDPSALHMPEYHVGHPTSDEEKLERVRRGLPVYCPKDPKVIDQTEYIRFAAKRPPNSAE